MPRSAPYHLSTKPRWTLAEIRDGGVFPIDMPIADAECGLRQYLAHHYRQFNAFSVISRCCFTPAEPVTSLPKGLESRLKTRHGIIQGSAWAGLL